MKRTNCLAVVLPRRDGARPGPRLPDPVRPSERQANAQEPEVQSQSGEEQRRQPVKTGASEMIPLLEAKQEAIAEVCRQFRVRRLEVFGSAVDGSFDPQRSDVDFLVEFQPGVDLGPWLSRYFDLKAALEAILGCSADLVMHGSPGLQNPCFAREVDRTRRVLYAA